MKGGVPFDIAFGIRPADMTRFKLDAAERHAISFMLSEMEGNKFHWNSLTFEQKAGT